MGFLVFQRVVFCDSLKASLVEKLFSLFAESMLLVSFLRSAPFFPLTHSMGGDMAVSYGLSPIFF